MTSSGGQNFSASRKSVRKSAFGTRDIHSMHIEKVVGSGMYGVVYKAVDKQTSDYVALKRIKMDRETQGFPVTAIREIKILSLMKNENIVCLREIVTYNDEEAETKTSNEMKEDSIADKGFSIGDVFMVFDFVDYDLSGLLKSPGFVLSDQQVKSYMKQLLSGVKFLHEHKILHRDIKSANLLITKNNVLKIADWGLARTVHSSEQKLTTPVVTLWYRSPEVICGSRYYGNEVDIWSVGCLFGEMKTKIPVFRADTEAVQLDVIFQMLGSPSPSLQERYSQLPSWSAMNVTKTYEKSKLRSRYPSFDALGMSLFEKLLDLDPSTRISADNALRDPYFTSGHVAEPSELPELSIEPVTEFLEQERKKEFEARRAAAEERARQDKERDEQQKAAAAQPPPKHHYQVHGHHQHHHHHHNSHHGASSSSSAATSSGSAAGNSRGGYQTQQRRGGAPPATESSKYKIVKPVRPAAATVAEPPPNPNSTVAAAVAVGQPSSSSISSNQNLSSNHSQSAQPPQPPPSSS